MKKNLPKPEDSGPKSEEGKRKVKYNALKHGFNTIGILPCKVSCYYRLICPVYEDIFSDNEQYIGGCALEVVEYDELRSSFENSMIDPDLVEEMIWLSILGDRINRYIAINPEMVTANNKMSKAYVLHSRVQNKILRNIKRVMEVS